MNNRLLTALIVVAASAGPLTGCRGLVVETRDRITLDGPVDTRVIAETPVIPDVGGVVPVPVPELSSVPRAPGTSVAITGTDGGKIALLDLDGLLLDTDFTGPYSAGENPVALFREKLDAIAADPCVRAVVVRVNSPGGGVAASEIMRRDFLRFRQRCGVPVVACLLDVATGGAYGVATVADRIVATPGTVTGGVGVILNLYNLRDLMGQYNVVPQEVKAGLNTDLGTPARALTPEGRQVLQAMASEFHDRIAGEIRSSRPAVDLGNGTTLDGRVFTATQAQARGLVDDVADLDDAIGLARRAGNCPAGPVVLYRRRNDPARSVYAQTPNTPLQVGLFPSLPGLDRTRVPTFLCVWQPEITLERLAGK